MALVAGLCETESQGQNKEVASSPELPAEETRMGTGTGGEDRAAAALSVSCIPRPPAGVGEMLVQPSQNPAFSRSSCLWNKSKLPLQPLPTPLPLPHPAKCPVSCHQISGSFPFTSMPGVCQRPEQPPLPEGALLTRRSAEPAGALEGLGPQEMSLYWRRSRVGAGAALCSPGHWPWLFCLSRSDLYSWQAI